MLYHSRSWYVLRNVRKAILDSRQLVPSLPYRRDFERFAKNSDARHPRLLVNIRDGLATVLQSPQMTWSKIV
jgi:hypothetical protein